MKRISAVFILLVNCFLLTLTALPHHHHHEAICFNVSHCHDGDMDGANHNHSHDYKCNFSQWLFERTAKSHTEVANHETGDCKYAFFHDFLFNVPETQMPEQNFIFLQRLTPACIKDYIPIIVCAVPGLRAPPHC